jgi:predicted TIM-barrel fold metal-dependent hydrolase
MSQARDQPHLENSIIVDSDVHIESTDQLDEIAKYIDNRADRRAAETLDRVGVISDSWDRYLDEKIRELSASGPEDIRQDLCEDFHVDYPILNAIPVFLDVRIPQRSLAAPLMRACNDWFIESYLDEFEESYGLASITTLDPEAAAEELDRLGDEDQIVGAFVLNSEQYPPLGDEKYDVMYQAAQDNDLTIAYHSASSGFQFGFPRIAESVNTYFETNMLAHSWAHMLTMTSLMVNGTPEKFPDLDFVFLEAGVGWIPYMMYRLNTIYSKRRSEAPLLQKSPEEYIRDQFYFGTQPLEEPQNSAHLQQLIEMVGSDSLLFCTDFPHYDFDHPGAFDNYLASFPSDRRASVLGANANRAFDLGLNI